MKIHTEKTFEEAIEAHLLAHGWLRSLHNDEDRKVFQGRGKK